MAVPRELIDQVRRLDEYELRRLAIVIRGLLLHLDGPPSADEPGLPAGLSYRQEHVRCGKATCTTCPHGPYWYAYWKEGGRTRKRYVGRHLPGQPVEEVVPDLRSQRESTGDRRSEEAGGDHGPASDAGPRGGSTTN